MDPKVLWTAKGGFSSIVMRFRLISLGDERLFEILLPVESFWSRVKSALKYVFKANSVVVGVVPLSNDDWSTLKEAVNAK